MGSSANSCTTNVTVTDTEKSYLSSRFGELGRKRVLRQFAYEVMISQYDGVMDKLNAGKPVLGFKASQAPALAAPAAPAPGSAPLHAAPVAIPAVPGLKMGGVGLPPPIAVAPKAAVPSQHEEVRAKMACFAVCERKWLVLQRKWLVLPLPALIVVWGGWISSLRKMLPERTLWTVLVLRRVRGWEEALLIL